MYVWFDPIIIIMFYCSMKCYNFISFIFMCQEEQYDCFIHLLIYFIYFVFVSDHCNKDIDRRYLSLPPTLVGRHIVFVLSVTQFVSATPLKLLNRISWNLVGSKDTICIYGWKILKVTVRVRRNIWNIYLKKKVETKFKWI